MTDVKQCAPDNRSAPLYGRSDKTDQELVAGILRGDVPSEQEFVLRFQRLVNTVLYRMRLRLEEREDIFQQVFLHLWSRKRRCFQQWQGYGRDEFGSFLRVVVTRVACDYQRQARTRCMREVENISLDTHEGRDTSADPTRSMLKGEQRRAIHQALQELSARDAELLRRRYYEEQTYREIARDMGLTINHVGVALARAGMRLRRHLDTVAPELLEDASSAGARKRARPGARKGVRNQGAPTSIERNSSTRSAA